MGTYTHNIYLFKAMEAYPYEVAKAMEALQYALSYEPENVNALCLMAKIQIEQLGDYEAAKEYYQQALASRMDIPEVYPDFIRMLVNYEDYDEAQKLIDFARSVKGIDRAGMELAQALLYEATGRYKESEDALREAKQFALNGEFIYYVDDVLTRVSKKREYENNKKRKEEKTEKEDPKPIQKSSWFQDRLNNLL